MRNYNTNDSEARRALPLPCACLVLCVLSAGGAARAGKEGGGGQGEDAKLVAALQKLTKHAQGYEPFSDAVIMTAAALSSANRAIRESDVQPGWCYRFFATASAAGVDVSLDLLEGGRVFAHSLPGPWAFADYCVGASAGKSVKVDARLDASKKKGSFIIGIYRAPLAAAAGPGDVTRALAARWPEPPQEPYVTGVVKPKKKATVPFETQGGRCKLVALQGDGGEGGYTLEIVGAKGAPLAKGSAKGGASDAVEYCFKDAAPGGAAARVTAGKGGGIFALAVFDRGTKELTIGGKDAGALQLERVHNFLKHLSPAMDSCNQDTSFFLAAKADRTLKVPVKGGVCYRMAAVHESKHGGGVRVEIAPPKGKKIDGKTIGEFAVADYCPAKAEQVAVTVGADAAGTVAFAAFVGDLESGAFSGGPSSFDLDVLLASLKAAVEKSAAGMEAADTPVTGMIAYAGTATVDVALDKDYCYTLIAVTTCAGTCGVELTAALGGKALASQASQAGSAVVELCPAASGKGAAQVKLAATTRVKEAFAFMPMKKKTASKLTIHAAGDMQDDYVAKKIVETAAAKAKGGSAVTPILRGDLMTNKVATFDLPLAGNVCYTIIAAGKPSVKDLEVRLVNPIGQEIARDDTASPVAVVETAKCPQWDGTYTVSVKLFSGYGAFGLQVFADIE